MDTLNEIREGFATALPGMALEIEALNNKAPAWIVKGRNWYGTAVEFPTDQIVSEKFASAKLWTHNISISGKNYKMLMLTSHREGLRHEFASLCAEFCEPGFDNQQRADIIADPVGWWKRWRELLGNTISNKKVYDVIGEMRIYEELLKNNTDTRWTALQSATHDIVSGNNSYEIKSTVKRYESIISINSQYQLEEDNENLFIVFCRFEPAPKGLTINNMIERLIHLGCPRDALENGMESLGLEIGRSARSDAFKLLDVTEYPVDSNFPIISKKTFKGDIIPLGVEKITYEINLGLIENRKSLMIEN